MENSYSDADNSNKSVSMIINGISVNPGQTIDTNLKVAKLYDYTDLSIPIRVICGKRTGPTLFVSAAIHGDELNGVEIIRRVLSHHSIAKIRGTLLAIPIVNVFGFNSKSRYLPDRRDLNRCFPGHSQGSLAGQLAKLFTDEVVKKSTHGIDLHTGAVHRTNFPQIRACLDDPVTKDLAVAFGAPVVLNSSIRDGSLRESAAENGVPLIVYEGGEALYFDEKAISVGVKGVLSAMRSIGMIAKSTKKQTKKPVFIAHSSHWLRAPNSGILRIYTSPGKRVKEGDVLGVISDPLGFHQTEVKARDTGILIGQNRLPCVNSGDALFHVATFEDSKVVEESLEPYEEFSELDRY